MKHLFATTCVDYPRRVDELGGLCSMIDSGLEITRNTFLRHVYHNQIQQIEQRLGYALHWKRGLTMAADWHITYYRSILLGKRVYYFVHSAIEYIFTLDGTSD